MNWLQALVLGIVEGVTEYIPVSSTGHLLLTQRLLGIDSDEAANAFAICIQSGAIVAVLGVFRRRVHEALMGLLGALRLGAPNEVGASLLRNLAIAFIPAAVLGYLLDDFIEAHLMGLWPITIAWLLGGFVILAADTWLLSPEARTRRSNRTLDQMSWQAALAIGLVQTIAMCPGTSRSLATIVGGLLFGLSLSAAVEFSFLLGVITLLAATVFKAIQSGDSLARQYDWWTLAIGGIAAWLSAVLAVRWMLSFLTKHQLAVFGYYRIVLAVVVGCGLYFGWIGE